ncbi:HAD family hydrolase [Flavitalea sp.]|nr:beta-phosphoglucomutase family hydrolase [Flavitalea sp.]
MAKGFVFDLNGTIIDDMHYHNQAWFDILTKDLKAKLTWEEVKKEMYGKNSELLVRVFGPDKFTSAEMDEYSLEKERRYQQAYKPDLKLIPGLDRFLEKASTKDIPMAIGSAAIMFNIDFILDNLDLRKYFKAVVSAEDVKNSKPDPETFLNCATLLNVPSQNCIVFEDAPKGVEAARNAGMKAVVIMSAHEKADFADYDNVLYFIRDYNDPQLDQLF